MEASPPPMEIHHARLSPGKPNSPSTAPTHDSILGKPFEDVRSHYTFGKELGQGLFAVVYLCEEIATGQFYACKSISKLKLLSKFDRDSIRREIQIMQHLNGQSNIVELKGTYEDDESVHLVMELCSGGELFDRIVAKEQYTEREAANICREIVNVVNVCHFMGVMHRDIKPENFLYATEHEGAMLKVIDFGTSGFIEEENEIGILTAINHGVIDYESAPWPSISTSAKDLVREMLNPDPRKRLNSAQVLEHPWIREGGEASDEPIDIAVFSRMKQFRAMNKLKKLALKVIAEKLSEEEIKGLKQMFLNMDTDNSGSITYEELKMGLNSLGTKHSESEVKEGAHGCC